jgi:hypothetical protein
MNLQFFYNYLFHPIESIRDTTQWPRLWVVFALFIATMSTVLEFSTLSLGFVFFYFVVLLSLLIIGSVIIDFIAQFFALKPNSKHLFYGLCATHIPYLLSLPLGILDHYFFGSMLGYFFTLLNILLFFFVIFLQVKTVQHVYGVTLISAFVLFMSPVLTIILGLIAVLFSFFI